MPTALVTGATAGIGASFARHLAARGNDVVLVARDEERLQAMATQLADEFEVATEVLRADLSVRADVDRVAARLEDSEHPVDVFVNNAGFGLHARLLDPDPTLHERGLDVMALAVLLLGGAAGRAMKSRGRGLIINTGSSSAWLRTGSYSAIKAFVNNYSESLYNELYGTGVHVMCLAPGWVRTEFHERAGMRQSSLPDVVWISADRLVEEALADAGRGKVLSIPSKRWRSAVWLAQHIAPMSVIRWLSRALNKSRGK